MMIWSLQGDTVFIKINSGSVMHLICDLHLPLCLILKDIFYIAQPSGQHQILNVLTSVDG